MWLALCICISGPAHPPKVKYSLSQLLLWLALCICISGPAHPPKEKYSLKAVIVACSYGVSFQDQHTLPKRNILSKLLLWLVLCICISGPAHPPKVKYSMLLWLILSARVYWPFKTSTHSQSEIFSLKAVIVACSLCSYTVAFQDQHTLPKRNILSHSCYCGLLCVFAFQDQHTLPKRNILSHSCYCGLLCVFVFQDQYTLPKRNILSKLLLWLARMELPFSTNTPSQSEIFYIYIYIDEQSTITENISLWEGVLVLKGQYL